MEIPNPTTICNFCEFWGVNGTSNYCAHFDKPITMTVTDEANQVYILALVECVR